MEKFHDTILYKIHQHKLILLSNFIMSYLKYGIISSVVFYFILQNNTFFLILVLIIIPIIIFFFHFFFWKKSYFIITNEKILIKVRNGIFSKFHMNIFYKNIRDMAYSKNNIFHYIFDYGTFFARSSAWADGDFEAKYIPKVEKIYKIINYLFLLDPKERQAITSLSQLEESKEEEMPIKKKETKEDIIKKESIILKNIPWIKEVIALSNEDRRYIFENEEDKNHGVYDALKKNILLCITHDENLRQPDNAIVHKIGKKVIFPSVNFHEIKRKNVVSSSPWIDIHNYLIKKFTNVDEQDATILIGFDID